MSGPSKWSLGDEPPEPRLSNTPKEAFLSPEDPGHPKHKEQQEQKKAAEKREQEKFTSTPAKAKGDARGQTSKDAKEK